MTDEVMLWFCGSCGHQTGGPYPQPALCRQPTCSAWHRYSNGNYYGGILRALPRAADTKLMAELRKHAPDHRYNNDREIIDVWLSCAKHGMQLPTWELIFLAHLFEGYRDELERLQASRAQPGTIQVGATEDGTEVAINCPYTPDKGSGWIHYAFTPDQARDLGRLLFKKADEADTIKENRLKKSKQ